MQCARHVQHACIVSCECLVHGYAIWIPYEKGGLRQYPLKLLHREGITECTYIEWLMPAIKRIKNGVWYNENQYNFCYSPYLWFYTPVHALNRIFNHFNKVWISKKFFCFENRAFISCSGTVSNIILIKSSAWIERASARQTLSQFIREAKRPEGQKESEKERRESMPSYERERERMRGRWRGSSMCQHD